VNVDDRSDKNFGTSSFEVKSPLETSFESRIENPYSGSSLKPGEGFVASSDEDFLPEMALKARSMALLADENSRKKPVRRSGKSKILKFNADPCSEELDTSKLIPEPEPEKMNFFQAYPEFDFSAGTEKRKKRRRLNEFAYIYGTGGYFESEPDFEEENYAGAAWNSVSEIVSRSESEAGPFVDSEVEYGAETWTDSENKSGTDPAAGSDLETGYQGNNLQDPLLSTDTEKPDEFLNEDSPEFLSDSTAGTAEPSSGTQERPEKLSAEKLSAKSDSLEASVPLYRICPLSRLQESGDLSELSDKQLEEAVIKIIEYEGPIHAEALLQRIKSEAGITRMLGKIKQRIFEAVTIAEVSGKIRAEGEFYWPISGPVCLLRRRDGDSSAKIEWICDEEIKEALRFVLNSQYSTPLEDLIVQTSRVLGIKTARKNTKERIERLVQSGIESNELTLMPNEMIYFAE
jgi:hypothetical protein